MTLRIVEESAELPQSLKKGPQMDERSREIYAIVMKDYDQCLLEIREKTILWEALEAAYRKQYRSQDTTRSSERSTYISHVTQQVVDDNTAELTDVAFGTGRFFDVQDNLGDEDPFDTERLAVYLDEAIRGTENQEGVERTLHLGELYGTAVAEIVVSKRSKYVPTTQGNQFGVKEESEHYLTTKAWHPKYFRFSPGATSLHECTWVGLETPMPNAYYEARVKSQQFLDVYPNGIGDYLPDQSSRPDIFRYSHIPNQWLMLRWYGMLPKRLVNSKSTSDDLVCAYVIVANREAVVYSGPNPFMTQDVPLFVYRPTPIAGTMWGLGSAEKVFHQQRAADRHFRTHEDALAYTAYPVTGMDSTRMPKGLNLKIKPGTNLLFAGRPSEIMERMDFGQPQTTSLETAQRILDWSKDTGGVAGVSSMLATAADAKAGSMALAMGPIIKKIKGRLRNLTANFLVPYIRGMAYRYMQFCPEKFPSRDISFKVVGVLGMAEREFEQSRWLNAMQTLGPESPLVPMVMATIMREGNLKGRETIAKMMETMAMELQQQKTEGPQEMMAKELDLRVKSASASKDEAEAVRMQAEAYKAKMEAEATPLLIQADIMKAMVTNSSAQIPDDVEWRQRYDATKLILEEMKIGEMAKDRESNERIAQMQKSDKRVQETDREFTEAMAQLTGSGKVQ